MNILEKHSIFFHFLSFSFMFLHCIFPFFPCFSCSSSCLGCSKSSFFLPRLPHDFLLKLLCKNDFWAVSGGTPLGPFFFSLVYFFIFFIFVLFFNFFPCFPFFIMYSVIFRLFSFKKSFFLFHVVSLFSFIGCSKSVATLQDSLRKSAHSELAIFALYWLVVTFPCGIVHILVTIRLRVVYGGRQVGQVLPSYQNRQISALDETADAAQSGLFSLLSSLICVVCV